MLFIYVIYNIYVNSNCHKKIPNCYWETAFEFQFSSLKYTYWDVNTICSLYVVLKVSILVIWFLGLKNLETKTTIKGDCEQQINQSW